MISLNLNDLEIYQELDLLEEIDVLKAEIDALRPLDKSTEGRIMQKFRLDWNYNSNAIEGNSLDYGETVAFLMHGLTAKGKPLKDHLDIKGHNETIEYLIELIRNKEQISEKDIREIHKMLLVEPYSNPSKNEDGIILQRQINIGKYKTMPNHVQTATGETHYYASPEDTPFLMQQLVDWFRESVAKDELHPVIIASIFHHRFTSIHPFDDGNGRMSRLLMNLVLMQYGFPPVVIKKDARNEYYQTLSQADVGDDRAFIEYIGKNLIGSLQLYLKGARGESIEEPSDLQKKIDLFKRTYGSSLRYSNRKKDIEVIEELFRVDIKNYLLLLDQVFDDFRDLFSESTLSVLNYHNVNRTWDRISVQNYSELPNYLYKRSENEVNIVLSFDFLSFKSEDATFSLSVIMVFTFHVNFYKVQYEIINFGTIDNLNTDYLDEKILKEANIQKQYNQLLTEEEMNTSVNAIGNDLLSKIQLQVYR